MEDDFLEQFITDDSPLGEYRKRVRAGLVSEEEKRQMMPVPPFFLCGEAHLHRVNSQPLFMVIAIGERPERALPSGAVSCFTSKEGADLYEEGFRHASAKMLEAAEKAGTDPGVKLTVVRWFGCAGRG